MTNFFDEGGGLPGAPGSGRPPVTRPAVARPTVHADIDGRPQRPSQTAPDELGLGDRYLRSVAWDQMLPFQRRDNYALTRRWLEEQGLDGMWVDHDEIGLLFQRAVWENWDEFRLNSALSSTEWWSNMANAGSAGRGFRGGGGGRSQEDDIANLVAELHDRALQYGLRLSNEQLVELATAAVQGGWNGARIIDALLEDVDPAGLDHGDITASADAMRELAGRYLLPMSDDTINDMAMRMARGELTMDGVRSMYTSQAQGRWSWMSSQLEQGLTPSDYFGPLRETLARSLEMNPNDIDLMDDRWMGMLEVTDDKGHTRGATMAEVARLAREQPEWANTQNAQQTMASAAMAVAEAFGRR